MAHDINKISFKKFAWYNLTNNSEEEISFLRENFDFLPNHLRDCATPPLRPKIEGNDDYIFMILLFPIYNRQTRSISSAELDIFIGKNYLVTIHNNEIITLRDFVEKVQDSVEERAFYKTAHPMKLLLDLLEDITSSLYPMLNHVSWDTDELDKKLFSGEERALVTTILTIKRNIVDIRKTVRSHAHVFSLLAHESIKYFGELKLDQKFVKLITQSTDIWEQLENHKATIDAIQETNESLISFQISDIMKTLTIFSVIIFPLTLIATIFSMKVEHGMPFINSPYGFWKAIGVLAAVTLIMLYYFKKKRWT